AEGYQVAKEHGAVWTDTPSSEVSFTFSSPRFLNWLLWEFLELFAGESNAIDISSVDRVIKLQCMSRVSSSAFSSTILTSLLSCKEALFFCAGIESVQVNETDIELHFMDVPRRSLVKTFLLEGRKRLCQLKEFGPALHDIKNGFVAIDILS